MPFIHIPTIVPTQFTAKAPGIYLTRDSVDLWGGGEEEIDMRFVRLYWVYFARYR